MPSHRSRVVRLSNLEPGFGFYGTTLLNVNVIVARVEGRGGEGRRWRTDIKVQQVIKDVRIAHTTKDVHALADEASCMTFSRARKLANRVDLSPNHRFCVEGNMMYQMTCLSMQTRVACTRAYLC